MSDVYFRECEEHNGWAGSVYSVYPCQHCLNEKIEQLRQKIAELEKEKGAIERRYVRSCHDSISILKDLEKQEQENQQLKDAIDEIIKYISKYQNFTKALEIAQKAKEQSNE